MVADFLHFFNIRRKIPSLEFLTELTRAFGQIPYENVTKIAARVGATHASPLLGERVFENYRRHGLGGTCFALVDFFQSILTSCGFVCYPVMADRSSGPDTHCALIVLLDGYKYLVDPGFLIHVPVLLNEVGEAVVETEFLRVMLIPWASSRGLTTGSTISAMMDPAIKSRDDTHDLFTDEFGRITHRYTLKPDPVSSEEFFRHWQASYSWPGMNAPLITTVHSGKQIYFRGGYLRINDGKSILKKRLPKNQWGDFVKTLGMDVSFFGRIL